MHFQVCELSRRRPLLSDNDGHSIVRLYTIRVFAQSDDPFYDGAPINMWSFIEVNVAIVCASVPGTS